MTQTFPPNPVPVYQWRQAKLLELRGDPALVASAKAYYRTHPVEFIEHWMNTYDPRLAGSGHPAKMPFILFPRQKQMVQFLLACLRGRENGLIEKSRDMGASWLACAVSVWLFLFWDGASIGWGSRKEQLVDRAGDPDSLFEKMRMLLADVPRAFLPNGFTPRIHCARQNISKMKILNPGNGASITGEAGHNIGRGGRKLIYFKDESAHYEQAESIEAALADTTNVQIDMSSVNGIGNVFHRRREAGREWQSGEAHKGVTNVFVMDWRDHPGKSQDWYQARRRKAEADGLLHVFAQEVERNYAASVEGVIIPPDWVRAAVDAHKVLGFAANGAWAKSWIGALDVADGGMDKNAFAARQGPVLKTIDCWAARDTGATTRKCLALAAGRPSIEINYDCIGVGAGVKAEANRLGAEGLVPHGVRFVPWDGGAGVLWPDRHVVEHADGTDDHNAPLNRDFYTNLKSQGWWQLRLRFQRTYRAVNEGISYPADQLISLPADLRHLATLKKELSQPVASQSTSMKLLVNKSPPGTRSPNLADAVMMAYWPMPRRVTMWDVV